ncbi:MAG TPA: amino acid permease [Candidatus Eremiobacteraceae bacterium]
MDSGGGSLRRELNPTGAISIVVGTVIGTGIFLKSAVMSQLLGSSEWVLAAWAAAGLLSIAGTLTYAELGAMLPHAGGPYVYLREAYGKLSAFLFGWKELLSTKGASNAAVAIGIVIFLNALVPWNAVWFQHPVQLFGETIPWQFGSHQLEAIAMIIILSVINSLGVAAGGWTQTILTGAKLIGIAFLIIGAFFVAQGGSVSNLFAAPASGHAPGIGAFGAAMIAALWAYSGWGDLAIAAGEVRAPGRNVPLGLIGGILIIMAAYMLTNAAYAFVLPFDQIATSSSTLYPSAPPVAERAAAAFIGPLGAAFLSLLFVISALGTLNGGILTGSRIPFAMARDGQFPQALAKVDPKTRTPVTSIVLLGIWASLLTVSGTFDQLTTLVVFVDITLDVLGSASIFVLRRKMPGAERPYRTPLYPLIPIAYLATLIWLIADTVVTSRLEALGGVVILLLGLPVYWYYRSRPAQGALPSPANL